MQTPHESLVLSQRRGLLVAVAGNLATNVGQIDIYDVSKDCRHPELKSTTPLGVLGHESGFAPDGNTFYSASPAGQTIVAVDITNPTLPRRSGSATTTRTACRSETTATAPTWPASTPGLIILDTSRGPGARARTRRSARSRACQWHSMSIPQNAIPITIKGHPYLVEIDEFGGRLAGRRRPHHRHRRRDAPAGRLEPAARGPPEGELRASSRTTTARRTRSRATRATTATCRTRVDPTIVACSMILSGLRVFDIRDPRTRARSPTSTRPSRRASSRPRASTRRRATGRCRARRSCPSATRSGTRTA